MAENVPVFRSHTLLILILFSYCCCCCAFNYDSERNATPYDDIHDARTFPRSLLLRQLEVSNCRRKEKWMNDFFDMSINISTNSPYQCLEQEKRGLTKIIEDGSYEAVNMLKSQFQNLVNQQSVSCTDSNSTNNEAKRRTSTYNNGVLGGGGRRLSHYRSFIYIGRMRCSFCFGDNTDSHISGYEGKVLLGENFESSNADVTGWTNGDIQQLQTQRGEKNDPRSDHYLGNFSKDEWTSKTFHIPTKTVHASIKFSLYLLGGASSWRPGDKVLMSIDNSTSTPLLDLSTETTRQNKRNYIKRRNAPIMQVFIKTEKKYLKGAGTEFYNSTIHLKLNPSTFGRDGQVELKLQFKAQTAHFGIDNIKVSGYFKAKGVIATAPPLATILPQITIQTISPEPEQKALLRRPLGRRGRALRQSNSKLNMMAEPIESPVESPSSPESPFSYADTTTLSPTRHPTKKPSARRKVVRRSHRPRRRRRRPTRRSWYKKPTKRRTKKGSRCGGWRRQKCHTKHTTTSRRTKTPRPARKPQTKDKEKEDSGQLPVVVTEPGEGKAESKTENNSLQVIAPQLKAETSYQDMVFMSLRDGLEIVMAERINAKLEEEASPVGHCLHGKDAQVEIILKQKHIYLSRSNSWLSDCNSQQ